MKLTRGRLQMHARMQGGALYVHEMLLDGEVVGSVSCRINKKTRPWSEYFTYAIGERTFESLADFKAALAESRKD